MPRVFPMLLAAGCAALAGERIPAFPGAEGAGAYATGGRGGEVYGVTNLNTGGPGSLADAVSRPNRIVVFTVSGINDLGTSKPGKGLPVAVAQPNITIAGHPASGEVADLDPGGGGTAADREAFRELLKQHVVQRAEKIRKRKQGAHKE